MSTVNTRSGLKKKQDMKPTPKKAAASEKQKKLKTTPSDISVKNLVEECRDR